MLRFIYDSIYNFISPYRMVIQKKSNMNEIEFSLYYSNKLLEKHTIFGKQSYLDLLYYLILNLHYDLNDLVDKNNFKTNIPIKLYFLYKENMYKTFTNICDYLYLSKNESY